MISKEFKTDAVVCHPAVVSKVGDKKVARVETRSPTLLSRYASAFFMLGLVSMWLKVTQEQVRIVNGIPLHSIRVPLGMTVAYLITLRGLQFLTEKYFSKTVDMKQLLHESMIVYNIFQVALNGWMVWAIIDALIFRGHPFIGDVTSIDTGATYIVWIHYCNKYLEFLDTCFMIMKGKKLQEISLLHLFHHISISYAWWFGLYACPGGDSYFGALLNSIIHVAMYGYYTLTLCGARAGWKKHLTQAQLLQFIIVIIYTALSYTINQDKATPIQKWTFYVQAIEMIILIVLFAQFHVKTYSNNQKTKGREKKEA